jgi:hypothetical protein
MASDESTGHRSRNLWPVRQESPGNPQGSGHRSASRDLEKSLLRLCYARLPPTFLVMKGPGVRVPPSASQSPCILAGFGAARWIVIGVDEAHWAMRHVGGGSLVGALRWIAGGRGCERRGGLGRPEVEARRAGSDCRIWVKRQARAGVDRPDRRCFVCCARRVDPVAVSSSLAPAG